MLNTIYEEFDFESKIKDLKNKKIKIKRIVKKDEHGNPIEQSQVLLPGENPSQGGGVLSSSVQTTNLAESYLLSSTNKNKINPTSKPNMGASQLSNSTILNKALDQSQMVNNPRILQAPLQPGQPQVIAGNQEVFADRKALNPMFYSTEQAGAVGGRFNSHLVGGNQLLNTTNNVALQKLNPGQDDQGSYQDRKQNNQVFMSQQVVPNLGQSTISSKQFAQDLKHLVLPRAVTQAIAEEDEAILKMETHINKEKKKIDIDFDQTIGDVVDMFNQQRAKLHAKFDDFLAQYKNNYGNLKDRVNYFKDKARLVTNKTGQNQPTQNISTLNNVTYYGRDTESSDTIVKLKDEKCKLQATIENIEKEVDKKLLNFLADELSKQSFHLPLYNHSETSQVLLTEIKMNIINSLGENLRNFNHLAYASKFPEFKHMMVSPTITSLISEDRTSVIGDYRPTKGLQVSIEAKFSTSHGDSILCMFALNEETIATGSKDSTIKIWNITLNKHLASLQGTHTSSVNALRGFRAFPSEMNLGKVTKGSNLTKFLSNRQNNTQEKELLYLASGGGFGDNQVVIWDIQKHAPIRILKGHSSTVTCIIGIKDGRTLLSSSQDSTIIIWDVINGSAMAQMREHCGSVNCMILSKDGSTLLTGSSDKTIKVWGLGHVFSVALQRKVLEGVTFQKSLEDTTSIFSINSSHMDSNIVFSGGADSKIKIWNIEKGVCEREIVGHQSTITELILFENPFDNKKNNFMLLSCGSSDELLRLSNPVSPINNGLMIDERLVHDWATSCSPVMQIIRNNTDDSIRVAIVTQDSKEKFFLVFKIRSDY